jgi:hypothetical protein
VIRSPAKAITAGALAFALGGVLLIAQPFDQQGSVPGAETDAVAATWVTGNIDYASSCSGPTTEVDGGVRRERDYLCEAQSWTATDPRLTGKVAATWNADVHRTDNGFISVNTGAYYLRNDDGEWACSSSNLHKGSGWSPETLTDETAVCVGQSGYEGLSAILVIDDSANSLHPLVGLIFPGDAPPVPQAPTAG